MPPKNNKTLISIIFAAIIILAGFGFPGEILATYYPTGNLISTNLLNGIGIVLSIDSFFASTTLPSASTTLWVQFATTSTSGPWYAANGVLNATTSIANGTSSTSLSGLGWSGPNFYYKMYFNTTDTSKTPALEEIRVYYTSNVAPTVSSVSLNGANNITLNENTTKSVSATGTVSDTNGYANISSVIGKIYRSGVGSDCSADNNNCYSAASCATSSCASNDCVATCSYNVQFYADPTDTGKYASSSGWTSQSWVAWIKAIDASNASSSATNSSQTVDINTLPAVIVTNSITYDSLSPEQNMANLTKEVIATTTGNIPIDLQIKGDDMTGVPAGTITITNQRYATSSVLWDSGNTASSTYQNFEVDLGKPTSHPSTSTDIIYWGWAVPSGTPVGTYTGTDYFNPVED